MASTLYSRYIPPKNKARTVVIPSDSTLPPSKVPSIPLRQHPLQQLSTKLDASDTYNRYIPPVSKSNARTVSAEGSQVQEALKPPKRKDGNSSHLFDEQRRSKRSKGKGKDLSLLPMHLAADETIIAQEPHRANGNNTSVDPPSAKEKKRKKRRETIDNESEDTIPPQGNDGVSTEADSPHHKSFLLKMDKSAKKVERFAKKTAKETYELGESAHYQTHLTGESEVHPLQPLPQPEPVPELANASTFSALPPWLASPIRVSPTATSSFSKLGIPKEAASFLQSKGFQQAFAVQAAVLPLLLSDDRKRRGDVLVSAATGSGKTLAYVLPMIADISRTLITRLRGIIIMPTRELVNQTREICEICVSAFASSGRRRIRIGTSIGNHSLKADRAALMSEEQRYDPDEYRRRQSRASAMWEPSSQEINDDDHEYSNFHDLIWCSALPNHIIQYAPKVDILICTPGRLVQHLRTTQGFTLNNVKWLVIDEADKLLDQSFQQWLEVVMPSLEKGIKPNYLGGSSIRYERGITKVVLSATVTRDLGQLSGLKLNSPKLIVLEGADKPIDGDGEVQMDCNVIYNLPETLEETAVKYKLESEKPLCLLELVRLQKMVDQIGKPSPQESSVDSSSKPEDDLSEDNKEAADLSSKEPKASEIDRMQVDQSLNNLSSSPRGVLIFTNSNEAALRLSRLLVLLEPSLSDVVGTLTSTISNHIRKKTLRDFQQRNLSILVASDLVARGLDIPSLAHVINYDLPTSVTNYIHRVGRTARAGRGGHAWTLINHSQSFWFWNEIVGKHELRLGRKTVKRIKIRPEEGSVWSRRYEASLMILGKESRGERAGIK